MTPRVVLIGLPGTGKTTCGRRLAAITGVAFADSDQLIEARAARSIADIFAAVGESAFRDLEAVVIAEALGSFDGVLALGGGAVLTAATRTGLRAAGVPVVWLRSSIRTMARRVGDGHGRPLLAGDVRRRLSELAAARDPIYRTVATAIVDADRRSSAVVAAEIARVLSSSAVTP